MAWLTILVRGIHWHMIVRACIVLGGVTKLDVMRELSDEVRTILVMRILVAMFITSPARQCCLSGTISCCSLRQICSGCSMPKASLHNSLNVYQCILAPCCMRVRHALHAPMVHSRGSGMWMHAVQRQARQDDRTYLCMSCRQTGLTASQSQRTALQSHLDASDSTACTS